MPGMSEMFKAKQMGVPRTGDLMTAYMVAVRTNSRVSAAKLCARLSASAKGVEPKA